MNVDICIYRMRIGLNYRCHLKVKGLKSRSLRKSDTFLYGLEIEKIDFSETLPIFNLY